MGAIGILPTILIAAGVSPIPHGEQATGRIPVLLLTGDNETDWRWTSTHLRQVLADSGKFAVTVSLYPAADLADRAYLDQFRVVLIDYAGPRWGDPGESNLLAAVEDGLGVVAYHAAIRAFPDWPEYGRLVGFTAGKGGGTSPFGPVKVTITDAEHPVVKGMGQGDGIHSDALMLGLELHAGAGYTMLANMASPDVAGGSPQPAVLVGNYGKGRVVASALGRVELGDPSTWIAYEDPELQQGLIRATEWVATGKVTPLRRIEPNTLTAEDRAAGWELLFDGESAGGWGKPGEGLPADRWSVENGCLKISPGGGDIVSTQFFEEFELEAEWRVAPGGDRAAAPIPEAQLSPLLAEAGGGITAILRPSGEFNHARVVARDFMVEHWLNGVRLLTLHMSPAEWAERMGKPMADDPVLGQLPLARFAAQDTGNTIWFRNIKIRQVPGAEANAPDAPDAPRVIELLNGRDLEGWVWIPRVLSQRKPPFTVEDGVLVCKAWPIGYLRTEASYGDFELELDYVIDPQTINPGDGGIMVRIGEDVGSEVEVWPTGIEIQLENRNAGDLWNYGQVPMQVERRRTNGVITEKYRDVERRRGEWNHLTIRIQAGDLTVRLNGEVVNAATGIGVREGPIAIKAEATDISYRNLRLTPL